MMTLKLGSRGEDVKTLQNKLGITADGIFGKVTDEAVRTYQRNNGLTPDGIVGPHTWERLGYACVGRVVDEIIVHCTATKEGVKCTSEQINASHKARKFSAYLDSKGQTRYIGYHYLIHPDGTIEACRPEGKIGCHASGHNTRSIGISYIGGLASDGKTPKDTRTPQQKAALIKLIKDIRGRYPTVKRVIGHRDTSPDLNGNGIIEPYEYVKACPCFNAIPEYKNLLT